MSRSDLDEIRREYRDAHLVRPDAVTREKEGRVAVFRIRIGKECPRCEEKGRRIRTPWYFRPLRWILRHRSSTRRCRACGRAWFALHGRRPPGRIPRRRPRRGVDAVEERIPEPPESGGDP